VLGTVNPKGVKTTYWFEYGPSISFGSSTGVVTVAAGSEAVSATANLTGLKPSTSYYFRIGAKNAYGVSYSGLYSFITSPAK
jgi:phosphodiesterase/alkaline phosphatase D-like protein